MATEVLGWGFEEPSLDDAGFLFFNIDKDDDDALSRSTTAWFLRITKD